MGDQAYLDELSIKYAIHDVQHLGANLAPWSQDQYTYRVSADGNLLVNEFPLLFYHFHEFQHNHHGQVLRRTAYGLQRAVAQHIYPPYEAEIASICKEMT